jgi:hypothetical protein
VYVEAVMVFSAGVVELGEYERVLREALKKKKKKIHPQIIQ